MTVLIHIGYHKTGSTLLQEQIFNRAEFGYISPWTRSKCYEKIILANPFTYDPLIVRKQFQQDVIQDKGANLVPVLSEERFSGNIVPKAVFNNFYMAQRLNTTFPDAKVLIVLRKQVDMILSIYKHRLRNNLTLDIDSFLAQFPLSSTIEPVFHFEYLQYHLLITHYQNLFGKESVLCLPYEMLIKDSKSFFSKISSFSGASIDENLKLPRVNEGYTYLTLYLKRYTNFFTPRIATLKQNPYSKFNGALFWRLNQLINQTPLKNISNDMDFKLRQKVAGKIEGFYQESNQKTSELIDINLGLYQYPI